MITKGIVFVSRCFNVNLNGNINIFNLNCELFFLNEQMNESFNKKNIELLSFIKKSIKWLLNDKIIILH